MEKLDILIILKYKLDIDGGAPPAERNVAVKQHNNEIKESLKHLTNEV